jgi:hypothetical protein
MCGLGVSRLTAAGNGEQKQERNGPACGPSPARRLPGRLADHSKIMTGKTSMERNSRERFCLSATDSCERHKPSLHPALAKFVTCERRTEHINI